MSTTLDIEGLGVFQVFTGAAPVGFLLGERSSSPIANVVSPYSAGGGGEARQAAHLRHVGASTPNAIWPSSSSRRRSPARCCRWRARRSEIEAEVSSSASRGPPAVVTEGDGLQSQQFLEGQQFVQTDARHQPGNSGGPIVDEGKNIVAVTPASSARRTWWASASPPATCAPSVEGFYAQTAAFGVSCRLRHAAGTAERYAMAAARISRLGAGEPLQSARGSPVVAFVEQGLAKAGVDRCSRATARRTGRSTPAARPSRYGAGLLGAPLLSYAAGAGRELKLEGLFRYIALRRLCAVFFRTCPSFD